MAWRSIQPALALALCFLLFHAVAAKRQILQTCPPTFVQYICAPSYVYPCSLNVTTCAWYSFTNGADYVIINPASGPGTAVNADYVNLVAAIRQRQPDTYITTILGYVATTYGNKTVANAQAEIARYNSFYKVDGIFLDEASNVCSKASYYSSLVSYVKANTKSPSGQDFTVLNWGTNGPECFLTAASPADTFVTFEHDYTSYQSYAPLAYMANYQPSRWYNIIYNVLQSNMIATVTRSKNNRAGLVYVTNDDLPNPYDTAPSPYSTYWQPEVNRVAQTC